MLTYKEQLFAHNLGTSLLEIGVGTGPNLPFYDNDKQKRVGLDPNPFMLDKAREQISRTNRKMELVEGHAERLPFQDATFDVVVMTNVLCSVESPSQCVAEVARVLKPGGTACLFFFPSLHHAWLDLAFMTTFALLHDTQVGTFSWSTS